MAMPYEIVSPDGTRLDRQRFGYSYSDLNSYGRLSDKKTCELTTHGLNSHFMDDMKLKEDGREYFSYYTAKLNTTTKMDPKTLLYTKVWIEKELIHVGNTSYAVHSVLKSPDRVNVLADATIVSVHVDKKTRQKRELPKWFKDKYGHLKKKPVYRKSPNVPRDWCYKFKVHPSDADSNQHANFASYITYSQNAVYKYEKSQSNLNWLEKCCLAEVDLHYLGDSVQGDELTVYVLKQAPSEDTFYISIEKQGEIMVKVRMKYTTAQSGSLYSKL